MTIKHFVAQSSGLLIKESEFLALNESYREMDEWYEIELKNGFLVQNADSVHNGYTFYRIDGMVGVKITSPSDHEKFEMINLDDFDEKDIFDEYEDELRDVCKNALHNWLNLRE